MSWIKSKFSCQRTYVLCVLGSSLSANVTRAKWLLATWRGTSNKSLEWSKLALIIVSVRSSCSSRLNDLGENDVLLQPPASPNQFLTISWHRHQPSSPANSISVLADRSCWILIHHHVFKCCKTCVNQFHLGWLANKGDWAKNIILSKLVDSWTWDLESSFWGHGWDYCRSRQLKSGSEQTA